MNRTALHLLFSAAICSPSIAFAGEIYRCIDPAGAISLQDKPCGDALPAAEKSPATPVCRGDNLPGCVLQGFRETGVYLTTGELPTTDGGLKGR